jgi:hypothetical protein
MDATRAERFSLSEAGRGLRDPPRWEGRDMVLAKLTFCCLAIIGNFGGLGLRTRLPTSHQARRPAEDLRSVEHRGQS